MRLKEKEYKFLSYHQNIVDRDGKGRGDRLSNDARVIWIREVSWPPVKQQHPPYNTHTTIPQHYEAHLYYSIGQ